MHEVAKAWNSMSRIIYTIKENKMGDYFQALKEIVFALLYNLKYVIVALDFLYNHIYIFEKYPTDLLLPNMNKWLNLNSTTISIKHFLRQCRF